jgi:hypothetical protein
MSHRRHHGANQRGRPIITSKPVSLDTPTPIIEVLLNSLKQHCAHRPLLRLLGLPSHKTMLASTPLPLNKLRRRLVAFSTVPSSNDYSTLLSRATRRTIPSTGESCLKAGGEIRRMCGGRAPSTAPSTNRRHSSWTELHSSLSYYLIPSSQTQVHPYLRLTPEMPLPEKERYRPTLKYAHPRRLICLSTFPTLQPT